MIRRIVGMLLGAALLLVAGTCSAADMRFVDAQGYTGYYVDASSVTYESTAACNATIAVIKADRNRMFRYTMYFDRGKGVYQIYASEVLAYDTKTVLSSGGAENYTHPYSGFSPMKTIVDFIYDELPHGELPAPAE
ncbi:hypothetical protein [Selenomonas sp.]|uniref:hypothetical protein n=1 Tax=Selenomonas sp. TaxID=2053611 RepID=UPI002A7FE275|nr:hypothetical protein [Selenomonas sp.]MDY4415223.1 hypothetical protein [Selenomonas sp.]